MENLFGKNLQELEEIALNLGEKKFRGKQLYDWIYNKRVTNINDFRNLPKKFLESLIANGYEIVYPEIIKEQVDWEDGTRKYLSKLGDNELVESVLMKYPHGYSACLSTQVGCNMGCTFCASGKNGKRRDLTAEEIAGQIVAMEKEAGERISNIVLMGMGEPLDNYDEVLRFIKLANEDLGIGQRHITLSTCGIIDKIYDLADEDLQINLAISLHSPFQEQRAKIMPIARKNNLKDLVKATEDYFDKTGRRVTYEYTVIDGVNNREQDAQELKSLFGGKPHHINLIPLNPVVTKSRTNDDNYVNKFNDQLKSIGLTSTIRKKNGANIEAACGQLRNRELEDNT